MGINIVIKKINNCTRNCLTLLFLISCMTNSSNKRKCLFMDKHLSIFLRFCTHNIGVLLCTKIYPFFYKILYIWSFSFNLVFPLALILVTPNILFSFISCLTNSMSTDTTKVHLKGCLHTVVSVFLCTNIGLFLCNILYTWLCSFK